MRVYNELSSHLRDIFRLSTSDTTIGDEDFGSFPTSTVWQLYGGREGSAEAATGGHRSAHTKPKRPTQSRSAKRGQPKRPPIGSTKAVRPTQSRSARGVSRSGHRSAAQKPIGPHKADRPPSGSRKADRLRKRARDTIGLHT